MEYNDIDESNSAAEAEYQAAVERDRAEQERAEQEFQEEVAKAEESYPYDDDEAYGGKLVEDRPVDSAGELYVDCPHCGKRAMINARAYQIDKLECAVLADKNNPDEPSWLDWDTALIEADFTYECEECGGTIAERMQELDDMRAAGTYNIGFAPDGGDKDGKTDKIDEVIKQNANLNLTREQAERLVSMMEHMNRTEKAVKHSRMVSEMASSLLKLAGRPGIDKAVAGAFLAQARAAGVAPDELLLALCNAQLKKTEAPSCSE